ncbi:hypothetical protein [Nocardia caishijiensis]|uniref:Uncharacterized protein n=1 Tax=Nocardia caishijiensis TaxID=184756 RepID=A0ABQ6YH33_9NOCA|nr:hypothetical protein [Nocardia caishijiensis]KAF0844841.1 hypothetical protein FNL39_11073 [Nocardia caishijiensis]
MRALLTVPMLSVALLVPAPIAAADPFEGEPAEIVRLDYNFGQCDTTLLAISSDVPVRLDITVRNQFDPAARVRIPSFLWAQDLPITNTPVTISVEFMAAAGEYEFDIVTGEEKSVRCQGEIFVL